MNIRWAKDVRLCTKFPITYYFHSMVEMFKMFYSLMKCRTQQSTTLIVLYVRTTRSVSHNFPYFGFSFRHVQMEHSLLSGRKHTEYAAIYTCEHSEHCARCMVQTRQRSTQLQRISYMYVFRILTSLVCAFSSYFLAVVQWWWWRVALSICAIYKFEEGRSVTFCILFNVQPATEANAIVD